MKIGAQLYTLREFGKTEADIDSTFQKVAAIGFEYVQVSGLADIGAANMRRFADKHGLKIILTHSNPERIQNDTEALIEEHKVMGATYIGIGAMPDRYRDDPQAFVRDFKPAAQKIAAAGMTFMYHNHAFEFAKHDGKLLLDHLIEGFCAEEMGFTLDTYWVQVGGADPAAWLRKLTGRVDTVHFKDFAVLPDNDRAMYPVLSGNLNWPAILEAAEGAGVQYAFIEQDECNGENPFDCLQTSFNNLKAKGY